MLVVIIIVRVIDGVYGNIMSFGLVVVFDGEFVFGMRSFCRILEL